jgi:hypothetical protein
MQIEERFARRMSDSSLDGMVPDVPVEMGRIHQLLEGSKPLERLEDPAPYFVLRNYLGQASNNRRVLEYLVYAASRAGLGGDLGEATSNIHYLGRHALKRRDVLRRQRFATALFEGLLRYDFQLLDPLLRPR